MPLELKVPIVCSGALGAGVGAAAGVVAGSGINSGADFAADSEAPIRSESTPGTAAAASEVSNLLAGSSAGSEGAGDDFFLRNPIKSESLLDTAAAASGASALVAKSSAGGVDAGVGFSAGVDTRLGACLWLSCDSNHRVISCCAFESTPLLRHAPLVSGLGNHSVKTDGLLVSCISAPHLFQLLAEALCIAHGLLELRAQLLQLLGLRLAVRASCSLLCDILDSSLCARQLGLEALHLRSVYIRRQASSMASALHVNN